MLPIDNSKFSNVVMASASASAKDAIVKDNYFDQNSLNAVKAMGRKNDPQALKEIAKKLVWTKRIKNQKSSQWLHLLYSNGTTTRRSIKNSFIRI